jgi:hypothetical protein
MRARSEATNAPKAQKNQANAAENQASGGCRIGLCEELVAQYH